MDFFDGLIKRIEANWILQLLTVGLGGFVGASVRFAVGKCVTILIKGSKISSGGFPYPTLTVNIVGCLFFGFLMGSKNVKETESPLALFLFVGMLGGFTTYSSFAFDTYKLLDNKTLPAMWNVILHIIMGYGAVNLGFELANKFKWKW